MAQSSLSTFPQRLGGQRGGEEDDEAMGRKEGETEGEKRKQTWKCNSKESWKAGEESFIYKCIQSIPAWGNAADWPLRHSQLRGVQSIGRRGQSRGVNGGVWVLSKTLIPRKTQTGHSYSSPPPPSPDAPALTHSAMEMISDCCLSEGRGRPNLVHIRLWRHMENAYPSSPASYQCFRASQWQQFHRQYFFSSAETILIRD